MDSEELGMGNHLMQKTTSNKKQDKLAIYITIWEIKTRSTRGAGVRIQAVIFAIDGLDLNKTFR